jgi:integrase
MDNVKRRDDSNFDNRMGNLEDTISQSNNRNIIRDFMKDCEIGKFGKPVGKSKRSSYLSFLKLFDNYWKKDFDKVSEKDIEDFISNLQKGNIKSKWNTPYSDETIKDMKSLLKTRFYKWMYQDDELKWRKLVGWIEIFTTNKEISALNKEEIEKVVGYAPDLRLKVFFQTLFDSGARITEYLNLKWSDFTYIDKLRCYKVRIRDETSKTFGRTITLPLSTSFIEDWKKVNLKRKDDDFFMPINHRNATALVNRWTKKVLKKQVGCHVFGRHSSATYYASKLMPYVFCKRFGWTMGSKMAARYIDREGIEMEEATEKIQTDIIKKYEDEIKDVKEENKLQLTDMQQQIDSLKDSFMQIVDAKNRELVGNNPEQFKKK